ncbi:hypothetical protein ABK040_007135 [Willaertia magna]
MNEPEEGVDNVSVNESNSDKKQEDIEMEKETTLIDQSNEDLTSSNTRQPNFEFQSHRLKKKNRFSTPLELFSESELNTTIQTIQKLHQNRYFLKHEMIKPLFEIMKKVVNPLDEEEKEQRRKQSRKQAKQKRKEHDHNLLNQTEMKKRKSKEIEHIRGQLFQKDNQSLLLTATTSTTEDSSSIINIESDNLSGYISGSSSGAISTSNSNNNKTLSIPVNNNKKKLKLFGDVTVKVPTKEIMNELNSSDNATFEEKANGQEQEPSIENIKEETITSSSTGKINNSSETTKEEKILFTTRPCYICKKAFDKVHFFYHRMCCPCGDFNYEKRNEICDLSGRVAFVTGGRVKIGYQTVLKLLRNGCTVIVTTRFPKDAAKRYTEESDFDQWKDRLNIYGLDLKHLPSVFAFTEFLKYKYQRLDIIINNAAQTLRRPPSYYRHVALEELQTKLENVDEKLKAILPTDFCMKMDTIQNVDVGMKMLLSPSLTNNNTLSIEHKESSEPSSSSSTEILSIESLGALNDTKNISSSSIISQIPLLDEDKFYDTEAFPKGVMDVNSSQVDLRETNSWLQKLENVPLFEFIEVQTVNTTAPFMINSRLKPLMMKTPGDKFIINVSSMEGQFYRKSKKVTHPHLNMAKASLNMMTRTSAADYAQSSIYMNSVDTGWNNDENPLDVLNVKPTYFCPLDEIDGASRIVSPIFEAIKTGKQIFGVFFKNYEPYFW